MPSGCKKSLLCKGKVAAWEGVYGGFDAPTGYDTVSAQFRLYDLQNGVSTCDSEGSQAMLE